MNKKRLMKKLAAGLFGASMVLCASSPVRAAPARISESSQQIFIPPYQGFLPIEKAAQKSSKIAPLLASIDRVDVHTDNYQDFHDDMLKLMVEWARVSGVPGWQMNSYDEVKRPSDITPVFNYMMVRTMCYKDANLPICKLDNAQSHKDEDVANPYLNPRFIQILFNNKITPELYQYLASYSYTGGPGYEFLKDKQRIPYDIPKKDMYSIDFLKGMSMDLYLYHPRRHNRRPVVLPARPNIINVMVENDIVHGCCNNVNYYDLLPGYKRLPKDNLETAWSAYENILRYSNRDIGSPAFEKAATNLFKTAPIAILSSHYLVSSTRYGPDNNQKNNKRKVIDAFINEGLGNKVEMVGNQLIIRMKKDYKYVFSINENKGVIIVADKSNDGTTVLGEYSGYQSDVNGDVTMVGKIPVAIDSMYFSYGIDKIKYSYLYEYVLQDERGVYE